MTYLSWRQRVLVLVGSAALVASAAVAGCGSEETQTLTSSGGAGGQGANAGGATAGWAQGGWGGDIFVEHGDVVSLTVDPAETTLDVINAAPATAQFTATATFEDGFVGPVPASWGFDRLDIGLIGQSTGLLSAHGTLGGRGTVTAVVPGLSATAVANVVLHVEENSAGLTPEQIALFDTPDPGASGALLYPYDATVFARDILAPELMWSGGNAGDAYLVHLSEDYLDAKFYVSAEPPSRFLMNELAWTALSKSNSGESVQVDVYRLSGATAYSPMHQSWTIAQGSLRGIIYYWAVNRGTSMKITPDGTAPEVVFETGPADELGTPAPAGYDGYIPPWSSGSGGQRCMSCHTVSKNGERLAGVFERKENAASPWGTVDLTQDPPVLLQIQPYGTSTLFVALTHDGTYAVQNDGNFTLHLRDATSGAALASELDAFTAVADSTFSGDDTMLAFSSNVTGSYPVEFSRADLDVVDFDLATLSFTNRRQLLAAGTLAVAFPSFSPDSKWVFYQKGDYSRANQFGGSGTGVGHNDLYMVDVAGQVGEIPLDRANGVGYLEDKNRQLNYQPNVNPIAVGGYYWMVFFSPRDYGNRMVSGTNPSYENRKQLWVAAVNLDPQSNEDPSHPAFFLRGQDLETINMKGYWVLDPCRQDGNSCDAGYECCTGFCQPGDNGDFVCSPPGECAQIGESCETAADCCDVEALCVGHFCAMPPPQ